MILRLERLQINTLLFVPCSMTFWNENKGAIIAILIMTIALLTLNQFVDTELIGKYAYLLIIVAMWIGFGIAKLKRKN